MTISRNHPRGTYIAQRDVPKDETIISGNVSTRYILISNKRTLTVLEGYQVHIWLLSKI